MHKSNTFNLCILTIAMQSKKQEEKANAMGFDLDIVGEFVRAVAQGEVDNVWCD